MTFHRERLSEFIELIEGDAFDVMPTLAPGSFQATITDPPYSERTHSGHDSVSGSPAGDSGYDGVARQSLGYTPWSELDVSVFADESCRITSGWVVCMTDHTLAPRYIEYLRRNKRYVFSPLPFYAPGSRVRLSGDGPSSWTDWIIVARTAKQMRWGTLPGGYQSESGWRERDHMGGKPTKLMRALIRDYSRVGDKIIDACAGGGTTGIAAAMEGRHCLLIEKSPEYCQVIRDRVARYEGRGPGSLLLPHAESDLFAEVLS